MAQKVAGAPREHTLKSGKTTLNYAEWAGDGPPIVLVHGVVGFWRNWAAIGPMLQPKFHVYALDMRGHGKSSQTGVDYGLEEYAADVTALIEKRVKAQALIVGLSLGGLVALAAAVARPELVRAVAMAEPSFCYADNYEGTEFKAWFEVTRRLAGAGLPGSDLVAEVTRTFPDMAPATMDELALCLSTLDPRVLDAALAGRFFTKRTSAPLLMAAPVPVLLMQGDPRKGGGLPDEEASWAMGLLADGTLNKWRGKGHVLHVEDPARFVREVAEFFGAKG